MTLHLYIVNASVMSRAGGGNVAIIAEEKENAVQMYFSLTGELPFSIVEHELKDGLILVARGPADFDVLDATLQEEGIPVAPLGMKQ